MILVKRFKNIFFKLIHMKLLNCVNMKLQTKQPTEIAVKVETFIKII